MVGNRTMVLLFTIISFITPLVFAEEANYRLELRDDGLKVNCIIASLTRKTLSSEDRATFGTAASVRTFVYGQITVRNIMDRAVVFDPRHYRLSLLGRESSKPYVDSVADFLLKSEILEPHQSKVLNVYWVFPDTVVEAQVKEMKLIQTH